MKHPSEPNYVPALGYHWLTPYYDAVIGATTRERSFKLALIKQARFAPGHKVLDLASGTGTLAIWIKQHEPQAHVIGVDGDPSILSLATNKAQEARVSVQFDQAMSYSLPYLDKQFDRAVSSLFFHHLSWADKERTARELFRVLKPGAELHVADWGSADNPLMRSMFLLVQVLDGFKNTQDNVSGKLIPLFEDAGFIDVRQRQTFSTLVGTMALYSAAKSV
ncbi:MAG: class I SAM-dependent methyltransferase [Rhodoferax sp.]|nr:class I SAM-dependent methyltransferase [Rhodoferax sp.]